MQEPVGIVDSFIATRVDLGAADERGGQPLQVRPVRGDVVTARTGMAEVMAPSAADGLTVEARGALELAPRRRGVGVEHRLVQDLHQDRRTSSSNIDWVRPATSAAPASLPITAMRLGSASRSAQF